jgi:hypothetical protein
MVAEKRKRGGVFLSHVDESRVGINVGGRRRRIQLRCLPTYVCV